MGSRRSVGGEEGTARRMRSSNMVVHNGSGAGLPSLKSCGSSDEAASTPACVRFRTHDLGKAEFEGMFGIASPTFSIHASIR